MKEAAAGHGGFMNIVMPNRKKRNMAARLADAKRAVTNNVIVAPTLVAVGPKQRIVMIGYLSDFE